jgi:hypothetical protein
MTVPPLVSAHQHKPNTTSTRHWEDRAGCSAGLTQCHVLTINFPMKSCESTEELGEMCRKLTETKQVFG